MHVNSKTVRARSASDRHLITKTNAVLALMTNPSPLHLLLMLINWLSNLTGVTQFGHCLQSASHTTI